jgi:hypothetical protein
VKDGVNSKSTRAGRGIDDVFVHRRLEHLYAHVDDQKLTTAKLAKHRGVNSRNLQDRLCAVGYLEIRESGKPYLSEAGKAAGGEFRFGKGPYFLWPADLKL